MSTETRNDFFIYEVFSQKNVTASFAHQFSLLAPNKEVALTMARENFLRREPCFNLWVVKRDDIFGLTPEERPFLERLDNKSYRETKGYGDLQSRWRQHKERYEDQQKQAKSGS
ncbi:MULTISPECIES: 1,2-phenylacetyl-CoA epoxidase subunit PaaB [Brevibacillus]|uniref:1,2-phenylacetyl-CoA epoxidase subunit B n=1 Tax=Brevibacillus invocatus TaxID=173959 RepID=A0A3M8C634_9BACL|nr:MULTISPECIES: 1,2-phenylacetyl-CoA epoxidase subunit PaaB [Brevibacillus]MCM3078720.1 1,2-phenylacetyl-CoA epoxidase subunit B [Brevibacillus invocatus]MCM3428807.1 1,2-phenylacetyl-CoA epoxidase subunit B [Brevibacillus invocatus]MDH4616291.1 1,2-phenylacetyl-CoA epoxidase subunit B [Brevibacillus sp. AY1]RNB71134.1 1,2-phenylacetyl-CoA epoxidase subunit B [Brevibacillus invocatus]